jgi:hypothetical protein
MKKLLHHLLLVFFALSGVQASAQVFDLSTGIVNGFPGTMQAVGALDDTWTVAMPGSPSVFQSATCMQNNIYGGADPSVRWLYPTGYNQNSCPMGDYYFKTTFNLSCPPASGMLHFDHIGGDDMVQDIIINGFSHPVAYTFNGMGWGIGVNIPVPFGELAAGVNEVIVHVYNWGPTPGSSSQFGLEINGNLTVTAAAPVAAFTLTSNGSNVSASSTASGTHTWVTYSSPTGNAGSYSYVGTYNTTSLSFTPTAPCYFIQHTVSNECGTTCAAQSICNLNCKKPCTIAAPSNLQLTYAGGIYPPAFPGAYKFSWNPVSGATSYVIEIIWSDPACCREDVRGREQSIPVTTNSYIMDISTKCFSWRVKAICADGVPVESGKKCESLSSGIGNPSGKPAPGNKLLSQNELINIFPNPAKESVSFAIESVDEVDFVVTITDISGKVIKTFEQMKTENKKASVNWNTGSLAKGIYIVKISTSDNQSTSKKLVIE